MLNKLSFYDIVGNIIPGAFLTAMLYWFLKELNVPLVVDFGSLEKSIIFLVISYLVGHIISSFTEALSARTEDKIKERKKNHKKIKRRPLFVDHKFSEDLLRKSSEEYDKRYSKNPTLILSPDYKEKLLAALSETWKIDFKTDDPVLHDKKLREAFFITYSFVLGKNLNPRVDVFNGIYGLSKHLLVAMFMAIFISIAIVVAILINYNLNGDGDYRIYSLEQSHFLKITIPFVLIFLFWSLLRPVAKLQEQYGLRLVNAVYNGFWVWYCVGDANDKHGQNKNHDF